MILVGYTSRIGRVDVESIKNFMKKENVEKVVIFCRQEPVDKIKDMASDFEIVITNNPHKDAKIYAKKLKDEGRKVELVDLQDFGERAIRDVC